MCFYKEFCPSTGGQGSNLSSYILVPKSQVFKHFTMKKHIFALMVIWMKSYPTMWSQNSINLVQFDECVTVDPVTNITDNLSGVCFNDDTGTLFIVRA